MSDINRSLYEANRQDREVQPDVSNDMVVANLQREISRLTGERDEARAAGRREGWAEAREAGAKVAERRLRPDIDSIADAYSLDAALLANSQRIAAAIRALPEPGALPQPTERG